MNNKKAVVVCLVLWLVATLPAVQAALVCALPAVPRDAFRENVLEKLGREPTEAEQHSFMLDSYFRHIFGVGVPGVNYDTLLVTVNGIPLNPRAREEILFSLANLLTLLRDLNVGQEDSYIDSIFQGVAAAEQPLDQFYRNGDTLLMRFLPQLSAEQKKLVINYIGRFSGSESAVLSALLRDSDSGVRDLAIEARDKIKQRDAVTDAADASGAPAGSAPIQSIILPSSVNPSLPELFRQEEGSVSYAAAIGIGGAASVVGVFVAGIPASALVVIGLAGAALSTLFYFFGDFGPEELSPDQFDIYRPDLAHRVVRELSYVGKQKLGSFLQGYDTADTYVMRIPLNDGGEDKYYIQFTPRFSVRKVVRDASTGKYSLHDVTQEEGVAIRAHMFRYAAAGRVIGDLFSPVLDFDATSGELKSASSSLLTLPERAVSEARALEQRVHATLLPAVGAVTAYRLIGNMHLSRINKALRDNKLLNYLVSRFGVLQQEDLKLYLTSKLIDYTYFGNKEGDGEPVRAFYNPRFRTVSLKTVYTLNDNELITTLAHEVAHHAWHVGLTADQKSAWIAHMRTAHPAFVQQTLERYKKIPDYFGELTTSEFALGGEVLATFVGEVLLGLGGPSLTVAVGKNVELVTDADILVLRDVGILHLDVVQALLAEREKAASALSGTVQLLSLDALAGSAADAAVRVADADKEMAHTCSHCGVMARFLQEKFGRVRVLREQVVLGQGDVSAARHELEAIVTELDAFLAKRRENRVQQETGKALLALHQRVLEFARVALVDVAPVSSDDVQKELAKAREEIQTRIADLEGRGASDAEHPEHEAWFALMDLKETIEVLHTLLPVDVLSLFFVQSLLDSITNDELHVAFQELYSRTDLTQEIIDNFFRDYSSILKSKPNKKIAKDIAKVLGKRLESVEVNNLGPVVTPTELVRIRAALQNYFKSPDFIDLTKDYALGDTSLMFALYGSLVTGYASQYSHHPYAPTDSDGLSDIDIGIVIKNPLLLEHIMRQGPRVLQLRKNGAVYYGPIKENTAEQAGPFAQLFSYLRPLRFAGRNDRKIGFIFVDPQFYNDNLAKDQHHILFDEKVIFP